VNTEAEDVEMSDINCVSKQLLKSDSERPLCVGTEIVRTTQRDCDRCKVRTIQRDCDRWKENLQLSLVQCNEETFFSRKLENAIDMDQTDAISSEMKIVEDKSKPFDCRKHCHSQITTEKQHSSIDPDIETDYLKPVVKPSDFYVRLRNLCNYLTTPGSKDKNLK
jgi:hypothetical protein